MSRADVETEILAPMQATFLPPRDLSTDETKLALKGYIAVLAAFDGPTLSRAWADVLASHKTRAWPVVGVIFASANKARKERTETNRDAPRAMNSWEIISETTKRLMWEKTRALPIASKAVEMGVAWALKCAVYNDGTPIDRIDLRVLRASANRAEALAKHIENGDVLTHNGRNVGVFGGSKRETALEMWRTLRMRETETQGEIIEHQGARTHVTSQAS